MLLRHCARRAASRAACTAGSSRAIKTAMMAMTTSNSIRVKPPRNRTNRLRRSMVVLLIARSARKDLAGERVDREGEVRFDGLDLAEEGLCLLVAGLLRLLHH